MSFPQKALIYHSKLLVAEARRVLILKFINRKCDFN